MICSFCLSMLVLRSLISRLIVLLISLICVRMSVLLLLICCFLRCLRDLMSSRMCDGSLGLLLFGVLNFGVAVLNAV